MIVHLVTGRAIPVHIARCPQNGNVGQHAASSHSGDGDVGPGFEGARRVLGWTQCSLGRVGGCVRPRAGPWHAFPEPCLLPALLRPPTNVGQPSAGPDSIDLGEWNGAGRRSLRDGSPLGTVPGAVPCCPSGRGRAAQLDGWTPSCLLAQCTSGFISLWGCYR